MSSPPGTAPEPDPRRALPSVDRLASRVARESGVAEPVARGAARALLEEARMQGGPVDPEGLVASALHETRRRAPLRRVLNATGVLLHTNLGRAPLEVAHGAGEHDDGYVDLEYDLSSGHRGARLPGLEASLCTLGGSEAALVVNNNAAAVLLSVTALASGAEVVVSRGQLVEIGGSFRIPEVVTQGGAHLVEVGTTNRTHIADYRGAIGEKTAALLQVHPSNYRIDGFTASVCTGDLARVASDAGIPLVVDLGGGLPDTRCGWLPAGRPTWLAEEPAVRQSVAAGADVVTFSGDKLLGGPQAGIIVGRGGLLERMRRHPLARAVRFDRNRAASLQRTVDAYLNGSAATDVVFWRLAAVPPDELFRRARDIVSLVNGAAAAVGVTLGAQSAVGRVGAGAAPTAEVPDAAVVVDCGEDADRLAAALRATDPPVVSIVSGERVWLHLRTVERSDDDALAATLAAALEAGIPRDAAERRSRSRP